LSQPFSVYANLFPNMFAYELSMVNKKPCLVPACPGYDNKRVSF
jgi:hypothetical protein